MKSWELLRLVFQKAGSKRMAQGLKLSLSLIHKWSAPCAGGSGLINPLDRIGQLLRLTGDRRLAQWICEQAGGFFVSNPPVKPLTPAARKPAIGTVLQEVAGLQSALAATLKDQPLTPAEAATLRARWEEVKSDLEYHVIRCEQAVGRKLPVPLLWLLGGWWAAGGLPEMGG